MDLLGVRTDKQSLRTHVHTDTGASSLSPSNPMLGSTAAPDLLLVLRNLFTPHRALSSLSPGTASRSWMLTGTASRSWMLTAKEKTSYEEFCLCLNVGQASQGHYARQVAG